jgi:hypothetical protein
MSAAVFMALMRAGWLADDHERFIISVELGGRAQWDRPLVGRVADRKIGQTRHGTLVGNLVQQV